MISKFNSPEGLSTVVNLDVNAWEFYKFLSILERVVFNFASAIKRTENKVDEMRITLLSHSFFFKSIS